MTQSSNFQCHFRQFDDLQVFEPLDAPIWVYDVQQKQILWANSAALRSWNVSSLSALDQTGWDGERVKVTASNLMSEQVQGLANRKIRVDWIIAHSKQKFTVTSLCSKIELLPYTLTVLVEGTIAACPLQETSLNASISSILYQQLVETSQEGIWVINHEGITIYANPKMARLLGDTVEAILGRAVSNFLEEPWLNQVREEIEQQVTAIGEGFACCLQRVDGACFWAEVSMMPLLDESGNDYGILATVTEMSDRSWNQLQLKEQTRILEAIATHQPLAATLKQLIYTLETLIPNRFGSFLLYDPNRNCLGSGEAISLPTEYLQALEGLPIGPKAGCCGTAAYRREPVIVSEIASDPLWETFRGLAHRYQLKAAWSYPIFGENGALLGTFCCYSSTVGEPTKRDLELTEVISHLAALAITQDQVRTERNQKLALVEAAADGIGMVEDDCFCYLNQAQAEMFGYESPEELIGCHWRNLYSPEEAARFEEIVEPILKQDGYWRGSAIAQRQDGTTFPQEISLTFVDSKKMICVSRDMSDRAETEAALQMSEQRYQLAAEGAKVGVWDWNLKTNAIYIAPNLKALLGYADHEIPNEMDSWRQLVYSDDLEAVNRAVTQHLTGQCPFFEVEHRMVHKNGTLVWMLARGQAQLDAQGELSRIIGSDTDITARKQAQRAESVARAAQQERDRYLQSLTAIQQELLTASQLTLDIYQRILTILGETTQASRAYLFRIHCNNKQERLMSQQAEWCAPGIAPEIDNPELQNLPLATTPVLKEALLNQKVYATKVADLPSSEQEILSAQGIESLLILPLWTKGELWGLIGLDQCDYVRDWNPLEMNFLQSAVHVISITQEKQQSQQDLLESETKYRSIFENITQGIFQVTFEGQYLSANPFLASLYGYDSPEDFIAKVSHLPEQLYVDPQPYNQLIQQTLKEGTVHDFELQVYRQDRTIIWISVTQHAVYNQQGQFLYFEGLVEDITTRKQAEVQLYYQAFYDELTQLANRNYFVQRLEAAIYAYETGIAQDCYAVFFIDLDRFKLINDSLGHMTGDELLQQVARRLEATVADSNLIARFGGDEFALLATNINSQADCSQIAQQLINSFQDPFLLKGNRYFVKASIGIALGDLFYNLPENLLRDADAAMYEAKANGEGYAFFKPEIRERILVSLILENDLEAAIQREEFHLYYQPLVYLNSNQLYGFEILVRWQHPQRGSISPKDFIPLAEQTGVVKELDAWVLKQGCRQLRQWQRQFTHAQDLVLSINLSPVELLQPNLVQRIAATLKEERISPHCLRFELTETAFLDDTCLDAFHQLQALGVQISIDDFGTGESSLSRLHQLHQLPLSTIKVDRLFVQQLDQTPSSQVIVQTIITLADSLGVSTLSEGIETSQQRDTLLSLGCLLGQGYLYSQPVPANVATQILATGNLSN